MKECFVESPYLVPFDGAFSALDASCEPPKSAPSKKECKQALESYVDELAELQRILYAHDRYAVLSVFQAMDAAGKDSTIRKVFTGVNPAGCQVQSFKRPSERELDHDFLWRSAQRLPERGRIGIFNRSYYEEVLVVRVHPQVLEFQKLPNAAGTDEFWEARYESIRTHERHLFENGTVVVKFWLNVSKEEQRTRFLSRLDEKEKNWKFEISDVREREFWDKYMAAYEAMLRATSRPWAPWYAIPADDKAYMRMTVAEILVSTLRSLELHYPSLEPEELQKIEAMRTALEN